jgi:hypothetical protein
MAVKLGAGVTTVKGLTNYIEEREVLGAKRHSATEVVHRHWLLGSIFSSFCKMGHPHGSSFTTSKVVEISYFITVN